MKSLTGFASLWMEGNLKEIETFLEGNFAEKKEIGRKSYVPKVEALRLRPHCHPIVFSSGKFDFETTA